MPYDKNTIKKADKGEYRLRATKEVVICPDFLMTWKISTNGNDDLDKTKMYGYIPPNEWMATTNKGLRQAGWRANLKISFFINFGVKVNVYDHNLTILPSSVSLA